MGPQLRIPLLLRTTALSETGRYAIEARSSVPASFVRDGIRCHIARETDRPRREADHLSGVFGLICLVLRSVGQVEAEVESAHDEGVLSCQGAAEDRQTRGVRKDEHCEWVPGDRC